MKRILCLFVLTFVILLTCNSCDIIQKDKGDDPVLKLSSVGFEGSLPNNFTVKTGLVTNNGLLGLSSSNEGSFITHALQLRDTNSQISIDIELPHIKFSNNYIQMKDSVTKDAAKQFYSFAVVKDKFSTGDKLVTSSQATDKTKTFRVAVYDQKNYVGYTSEQTLDQTGSHIKVLDLVEGTENDPKLGNVKTLEITFDLDVKLYEYSNSIKYIGNIKGLVRMKYKEKV